MPGPLYVKSLSFEWHSFKRRMLKLLIDDVMMTVAQRRQEMTTLARFTTLYAAVLQAALKIGCGNETI